MRFVDLINDMISLEEANINKYRKERLSLSTEMIAHQYDDAFVKSSNKCFEEIFSLIDTEGYTDTEQIFKSSKGKGIIDRLDNLILDRFGIPSIHEADSSMLGLYACLPIPPYKNTILDEDWQDTVDLIGDYENIRKKTRAITSAICNTGLTIDLNKAYISGLPNNYNVMLLGNFINLHKCGMTPQEATAVLLHEIGHTFTHIEYSYKMVQDVNVISETVIENTQKRGKSPKETLLLIGDKLLSKEERKKLENKSTPMVAVGLIQGILKLHNGNYYATDSEQLADQFSGRFGLGSDLTTALDKTHKFFKTKIIFINLGVTAFSIVFLLLAIVATSFITILLGSIGLSQIIFNILPSLFGYDLDFGEKQTYDYNKDRFNRIKLELIRRLRQSNIRKDAISNLVYAIDHIDRVLNKYSNLKQDPIGKIITKLSSSRSNMIESRELEQALENAMENDLHVASARLKTLNS